jgi:transposase-like protein
VDLVERGVDTNRRYIFVIEDSKALRSVIKRVFGARNPFQRCRKHKVKNVCDNLPDELAGQVKAVMKAAYRLPWQEGVSRLKTQAKWLKVHYPWASASLLEGLEETITINRLQLPGSLRRYLATTNVLESPYSGVRRRTGRVTWWKDGKMVMRWAASALLAAEKKFRRIQGYRALCVLKAKLEYHLLEEGVREAA